MVFKNIFVFVLWTKVASALEGLSDYSNSIFNWKLICVRPYFNFPLISFSLRFKKHIDENQPKDVLDLDEFLKIRQEVVASKSRPGSSAEDEDVVEEDMDTGPPGAEVEAPPGTEAPPPGMEEPAKVRLTRPLFCMDSWALVPITGS